MQKLLHALIQIIWRHESLYKPNILDPGPPIQAFTLKIQFYVVVLIWFLAELIDFFWLWLHRLSIMVVAHRGSSTSSRWLRFLTKSILVLFSINRFRLNKRRSGRIIKKFWEERIFRLIFLGFVRFRALFWVLLFDFLRLFIGGFFIAVG